MSKTKTKEELVRLGWLTELRRQGDRQFEGALRGYDNKVCALGLLAEVANYDLDVMSDALSDIGGLAGLDGSQSERIATMNDDDGLTFAEIATEVETWFPND